MTRHVRALLPTALLSVLVLWTGTFQGVASAHGSLASQLAVVVFCLLATPSLTDPLALGRAGRWIVPTILALVALSAWFSPVARAALLPTTLLPAYLLLPAATARCWDSPARLRIGLLSLSFLYLLVSLLALALWRWLALDRASLPLGHHNLLAGWLVLLFPVVAVGAQSLGGTRALSLSAALAGLAAMVISGSRLGLLALICELLLLALLLPKSRKWVLAAAAATVAVALPGWLAIGRLTDPSAIARLAYVEAGWRGIVARPWLGWGPGSTPWVVAEHMRPVAGVHPASEVIGDLHSLPLQVGFELGLPALALSALATGLFLLRGWRRSRITAEPLAAQTALVAILGALVFAVGSAPLSVPALPATTAIVAGLLLAPPSAPLRRSTAAPLWVYALVALVVLAPAYGAHFLYDQARRAPSGDEALVALRRAHTLDPGFPLYAARWAWSSARAGRADLVMADRALSAARSGRSSAPLWLAAGALGLEAEAPWAQGALLRAVELDPQSPLAAFLAAQAVAPAPQAIELGLRSVTLDARLARAVWWTQQPDIARQVGRLSGLTMAPELDPAEEKLQILALDVDRTPATSYSLYAFRRLPWPETLVAIELRR